MVRRMFAVDEADVAAIRRVFTEEGELSAIVELRRRFPGVARQWSESLPDEPDAGAGGPRGSPAAAPVCARRDGAAAEVELPVCPAVDLRSAPQFVP